METASEQETRLLKPEVCSVLFTGWTSGARESEPETRDAKFKFFLSLMKQGDFYRDMPITCQLYGICSLFVLTFSSLRVDFDALRV